MHHDVTAQFLAPNLFPPRRSFIQARPESPFYTCTSQPPHNNHMITEPEAVDKRNQCLGEEGDWQDGMTLFSMYEDWTRVSLLHDRVLCLHAGRYACRPSALTFFFVHVQCRTVLHVCAYGCWCLHSPRAHMDIDTYIHIHTRTRRTFLQTCLSLISTSQHIISTFTQSTGLLIIIFHRHSPIPSHIKKDLLHEHRLPSPSVLRPPFLGQISSVR